MTKYMLRKFYKNWKKTFLSYRLLYRKNRLTFPEPLQKDIVIKYFDASLIKSNSGSYDFINNIELKSSTALLGCTPFNSNQNNCSRIIYMEIDILIDMILIYELSQSDVQLINSSISNGVYNLSLSHYKKNATNTVTIKL